VLILTTFDLDEYVFAALRAGASGFLLKDTPPGCVAHREELFRVRATALAAHLLRRAELHIQGSVSRAPVAAGPAAYDRCLRRVKNSRHSAPSSGSADRLAHGRPLQYLIVITGNQSAAWPDRRLVAVIEGYREIAEVAPVLRSQLLPGRQGSAQMVVRLMSLPSSMRWPGTS
jgi:hypothetical protein